MVTLVLDLVPLSYLFMVGSAVALLVNFPKISDQAGMGHRPLLGDHRRRLQIN